MPPTVPAEDVETNRKERIEKKETKTKNACFEVQACDSPVVPPPANQTDHHCISRQTNAMGVAIRSRVAASTDGRKWPVMLVIE